MKKIVFAIILIFCLLNSRAGAFDDIQNNWYKDSILALEQQGIINGYDENTFAPENTITRAEVLKIILAAAEKDI